MARGAGVVKSVSESEIVVTGARGDVSYTFQTKTEEPVPDEVRDAGLLVLPKAASWQEAAVAVGDKVAKKQLLARGVTHVFFQANVWIFTFLVFIVGIAMGIGKAAVYRHIPDYFPNDVGVVGGMVGVLGGLGGFVCPIIFGYLLEGTGLWTTCWMFFLALTAVCMGWMLIVIRRRMREQAPGVLRELESDSFGAVETGT